MRKPIRYILCLLLGLFVGQATALLESDQLLDLPPPEQTNIPQKVLTLHEAILLALRQNPNVRSAEIQRVADKFALEVAHNQFAPQYTFNAQGTFQSGSGPQYQISPSVSLLTAPGTQFQVNYNNTFSGGGSSSISTTITQPLLRGFGPQVTLAPLTLAEYQENINRLNLKNTIMQTVTQIVSDYYQLVQGYNNLTINELALEDSLVTLHQLQIKIKSGVSAPMEIVQQQSQVASQELAVTQAKNTIQQNYLTLLTDLGLDPNSKLIIDKTIKIDDLRIPGMDESFGLALANNVAYLQGVFSLKQAETNLLVARDAQRWQLNLVATKVITPGNNSNNGVAPINSVTNNNGNFISLNGNNQLVSTPGNDSVQLNLNIPIDNKPLQQQLVNAKVALEQQKIQLDQTQRATRTAVINGIQSLTYQLQQIQQAEAAVKYAQQSLDVELIKLRYGRSTVFEVTQLRTNLTNAQLSLVSQQIAYINTLAQFEQTLGITLDKWGIQLYY